MGKKKQPNVSCDSPSSTTSSGPVTAESPGALAQSMNWVGGLFGGSGSKKDSSHGKRQSEFRDNKKDKDTKRQGDGKGDGNQKKSDGKALKKDSNNTAQSDAQG